MGLAAVLKKLTIAFDKVKVASGQIKEEQSEEDKKKKGMIIEK